MLQVTHPVNETDLPQLVEVYNAAFSTSIINQHRYPNGPTEVTRAQTLKFLTRMIQDPTNYYFVVVDTESDNRIVAWINWEVFKVQQPESEWKKALEPPPPPAESHPDINAEFSAKFFGGLSKLKRNFVKGKPRVHIGLLITHPDYQRRGIGKMLLDKCAEQADQLGLPTVLEASPVGAPLYKREGFIAVEGAVVQFYLKDNGQDVTHTSIMMERPIGGIPK